jgi:hypothetical protein
VWIRWNSTTSTFDVNGGAGIINYLRTDGGNIFGNVTLLSGGILTASDFTAGTTNFVSAVNLKAPIASPTFTGTPAVPNVVLTDTSTTIAPTAFVASNLTAAAHCTFDGENDLITLDSTARYVGITGGGSIIPTTSETNAVVLLPFNATIKNLYVTVVGVGSGTNVTVTLMTNGVASAVVAAGRSTGATKVISDTTHTSIILAGTSCSLKYVGDNGVSTANLRLNWIMQGQTFP